MEGMDGMKKKWIVSGMVVLGILGVVYRFYHVDENGKEMERNTEMEQDMEIEDGDGMTESTESGETGGMEEVQEGSSEMEEEGDVGEAEDLEENEGKKEGDLLESGETEQVGNGSDESESIGSDKSGDDKNQQGETETGNDGTAKEGGTSQNGKNVEAATPSPQKVIGNADIDFEEMMEEIDQNIEESIAATIPDEDSLIQEPEE
jgi:hypothetical protein